MTSQIPDRMPPPEETSLPETSTGWPSASADRQSRLPPLEKDVPSFSQNGVMISVVNPETVCDLVKQFPIATTQNILGGNQNNEDHEENCGDSGCGSDAV